MSTHIATFLILVLLAGISFHCNAFEPFQKEQAFDPVSEEDRPDDFLHHFLLHKLPVLLVEQNGIVNHITVKQWLEQQQKHAVVLFVNRLWPDAFAQTAPFERLNRSYSGDAIAFAIVYIHRKPEAYLKYVNNALQAQHIKFTADIRSLEDVYLDFSRPLFLFTDSQAGILFSKHEYLSYKNLQAYLDIFAQAQHTRQGDSP